MSAADPKTSPGPHNSSSSLLRQTRKTIPIGTEQERTKETTGENGDRRFGARTHGKKQSTGKAGKKKREPPNPPSGGAAPARAPRSPENPAPSAVSQLSPTPPRPRKTLPASGSAPVRGTTAASRPASAVLRGREAEIRPRPRPPGPAGSPFPQKADKGHQGLRCFRPGIGVPTAARPNRRVLRCTGLAFFLTGASSLPRHPCGVHALAEHPRSSAPRPASRGGSVLHPGVPVRDHGPSAAQPLISASACSGLRQCSITMTAAPTTPALSPATDETMLRCSVASGSDRW